MLALKTNVVKNNAHTETEKTMELSSVVSSA